MGQETALQEEAVDSQVLLGGQGIENSKSLSLAAVRFSAE